MKNVTIHNGHGANAKTHMLAVGHIVDPVKLGIDEQTLAMLTAGEKPTLVLSHTQQTYAPSKKEEK